ncbi:hypothetical protein CYMTET_14872 [Cymbomonas tetramitiformis]|uniref:Helicase ATP-binding domain-containing protein n=1 Tax=Cymbomonas tetramitiformis TaxID=36881 RepID=A0AAE0L9X0_9CHLO|nr:hypothetical protein CYMTET_14872 [Cymbomonas tetramitiformis]
MFKYHQLARGLVVGRLLTARHATYEDILDYWGTLQLDTNDWDYLDVAVWTVVRGEEKLNTSMHFENSEEDINGDRDMQMQCFLIYDGKELMLMNSSGHYIDRTEEMDMKLNLSMDGMDDASMQTRIRLRNEDGKREEMMMMTFSSDGDEKMSLDLGFRDLEYSSGPPPVSPPPVIPPSSPSPPPPPAPPTPPGMATWPPPPSNPPPLSPSPPPPSPTLPSPPPSPSPPPPPAPPTPPPAPLTPPWMATAAAAPIESFSSKPQSTLHSLHHQPSQAFLQAPVHPPPAPPTPPGMATAAAAPIESSSSKPQYISTIATASQVDASQVAILNITDAATGVTMGRRTLMQTTMGVQVESIVTFLANEVQLWEDFDNALQNNPQEVFSEENGWADESPEVFEVDSTLKVYILPVVGMCLQHKVNHLLHNGPVPPAMPPPPPSTESPTAGIAEEEVETGEGYPSPDDGDANDSSNNDGTTTIIIAVVCSVLGVFMIGGGIFAVWHFRFKQQELPVTTGSRAERHGEPLGAKGRFTNLSLAGCLDRSRRGRSELVYCAPTSGGKSLVSEVLLIRQLLRQKSDTRYKVRIVLPYLSVVSEKEAHLSDVLKPIRCKVKGFHGLNAGMPFSNPKGEAVAICTMEKANMIIDEIHSISDPGRGPSLEKLITKLVYTTSDGTGKPASSQQPEHELQIVGMSGTVGGVEVLLSKWLQAELILTNFRPVPLTEYAKCGDDLYKLEGGQLHLVPAPHPRACASRLNAIEERAQQATAPPCLAAALLNRGEDQRRHPRLAASRLLIEAQDQRRLTSQPCLSRLLIEGRRSAAPHPRTRGLAVAHRREDQRRLTRFCKRLLIKGGEDYVAAHPPSSLLGI